MRQLIISVLCSLIQIHLLVGQTDIRQNYQTTKRIALVIGNGNYTTSVLANPENDARSMTELLKNLGFTVFSYTNLGQTQMKKAIDDFGEKLNGNDVGLFYYAGHGLQSKGYNYLIPVDAKITSEPQVEYDCVRADRILAQMEATGTSVNLIILDACRDNPFERSWTRSSTGKGLAFMSAPRGTLIAYATAPGSTASDGAGKNGLYTSAILETFKTPNLTIIQIFQIIRNIVSKKSNNNQIPWESTSLTGDFYFIKNDSIPNPKINNNKLTQTFIDIPVNDRELLLDTRDNKYYNIIQINGKLWMADNIEFKPINGNYWPIDGSDQNLQQFGYLYDWETAREICPIGWHLPSSNELIDLFLPYGKISYASSEIRSENAKYSNLFGEYEPDLTSSTYYNIISDKKLNIKNLDDSQFENIRTMFWSSSLVGNRAYAIYLRKTEPISRGATVHFASYPIDLYGFCRCVKD